MASHNEWTFSGNLGDDPKAREHNGQTVCNLSVAVNGRRPDDPTMWVRVAVWGKQGDACAQYLAKGRTVIVTGPVSLREYEHNGERRTSLEVNARAVTFAGGSQEGGNGGSNRNGAGQSNGGGWGGNSNGGGQRQGGNGGGWGGNRGGGNGGGWGGGNRSGGNRGSQQQGGDGGWGGGQQQGGNGGGNDAPGEDPTPF